MIRRPIAVFVARFPLVTETFVVREIEELERQGQPVVIVPLFREHPSVVDPAAMPWIERALFTPRMSVAIARSTLRTLLRQPGALLRILSWILTRTILHPRTMARSISLVPKACHLASVLMSEQIAHLHAHRADDAATVARIISVLSGIAFSLTVHGSDVYVDRSLLRAKMREAVFIRSVSHFNRQLLETLYPIESEGKIEIVRTGITIPSGARVTSPAPSPDEEGGRGRPPSIISVGALEPRKGFLFLIDACRLLAEEGVRFRCEILGDGPMRGAIRRAAIKGGLGDRVRFHGAVPPGGVAEAVAEADIFALASVIAADRSMDDLPVALLEAMSFGKAVVASAISGMPEVIVDNVSGLLVDPGNPRTLANALRRLIADPALRERLGKGAYETAVRAFDLRACTAIFLRLIDRHRPAADPATVDALRPLTSDDAEYGLRRVRRSADSIVYELSRSNGNGNREVVLKQHLSRAGESRPASARAAEEFDLLQRLAPHFALTRNLGIPAPLQLDAPAGVLMMSRAPGVPLTKLIRDARDGTAGDAESLRTGARAAGAWLHRFQQIESAGGAEALDAVAMTAIEDARDAGYRRIEARIRSLQSTLREHGVTAVTHHGDFWPGNVFVAGESVQVIDFEGAGLSLAAHDVAYFFLHVSLYFRWRNETWLNDVRDCFFAGYAGAIDPAELELCRLATALQLAKRRAAFPPVERFVRNRVVWKELSR